MSASNGVGSLTSKNEIILSNATISYNLASLGGGGIHIDSNNKIIVRSSLIEGNVERALLTFSG